MYSGGLASDGKVYCNHREEAAKRKSNTPKHPNREFYCCKRHTSDENRCKFWHWVDQVPRAKEESVDASSLSAAQPSPRPPKDWGARERPAATPPRRPSQKHVSPSNGPPETPRSKKRLEDIEVGLRQREQDLSPIRHISPIHYQASPPKEQGPSTSLPPTHPPPSPVPTEIDDEVEPQPRKSFLGLEYSPEPIISTIKVEDQPSVSKKRRLTPPTKENDIQPVADASFDGEAPPTPPETTRRIAQADDHEPARAIIRSRKGKEREGIPPIQTQDQDGPSWEPQEEDSLPLFTRPEDMSSTSSVSPTIAENVLDYTNGMQARVKALSEYMDSFDVIEAAKSLRTIERQKIQYECRDRSQKMRMEELVADNDRLVAEIARLKEALKCSEESNRVKDAEMARLKVVIR